MIEKLLFAVNERKRKLELSIFEQPPVDMADLNKRLGRWMELSETAAWCAKVIKADPDDEDRL
jgi:hypothetical protein